MDSLKNQLLEEVGSIQAHLESALSALTAVAALLLEEATEPRS